ncbi:universal stress protein [Trinickia caryophylli]|uniref:Nucleotide-binding universal stress protein, UspA family n=1 Tax=Trinickia caryophylli TaxID=28094 RepID=A0A1X7H525_TRICW|nr:universal stress protein [Trinickia caryophylli]PMS09635.1 universal stress protein [Trinickia caryophylli]TRX17269.1 universal stress protein [Trinickia caryophylli]WQE11993.1 universal stress protein [Trinickia caryophylli]SMF79702.1 Nucleotide-binding universal stress protein, UspA family [Trinickia caryophylli]GLU35614.1 universal stress protein A [Trinickia caryophylli]
MYRRIIAPIDGSPTSARAFDAALDFAKDSGATLAPLYVVDVPLIGADAPGYDPSIVRNALFEEGERLMSEARAKMEAAGVTGEPHLAETTGLGDDIAHCILKLCREWPADLVIMGTHGRRGFQRLVLGSVAEQFLRISCCPVLLIPAGEAGVPQHG